jgi:hypothetical protein
MKRLTALALLALVALPAMSQDENEVLCPSILPTNPNNSSNSAEIVFFSYDMDTLATCTCNHAGQGGGTEGRYNCGTCMPDSWSFAQIDSDNPCINPSTLPVKLMEYTAVQRAGYTEIYWITASEQNNDYFLLEATTDGITYRTVAIVRGNGNSSQRHIYTVKDTEREAAIIYYRLTQFDYDGQSETFPLIAIDNRPDANRPLRTMNLQGQEVNENYKGLVIDHYSDGTSVKRMQN